MEFSQAIIDRTSSPQFRVSDSKQGKDYLFKLDNLGVYVELFLELEQRGDDQFITALNYKTALDSLYLGLVDGLIALYQDKALEAISRVSAKELDHFLRDEPSTPAVSYFDAKFYDVLSLGSKLVEKISGKEKKETYLFQEIDGDFFELSFSEQVELFEEFLAKKVYPFKQYDGIGFDLADVDDKISIEIQGRELGPLENDFKVNLEKELNLKSYKVEFI